VSVSDTIAAVATPPGRGGVGIVRISGPACSNIVQAIIGLVPDPRHASLALFRDAAGTVIDEGIVLFFPAPNSFTGEDVLEFQGHGGPVVMDLLLSCILSHGARMARPGEFSERAFLNDKLDLVQAESIADLIEADTAAAARLATRTLQGAFSNQIHGLVDSLVQLRMYVEAAIDFPEEEIDFLSDGKVSTDLQSVMDKLKAVQENARVGRLLRDGMHLVIAGQPNAGKSSLLNALAGRESAIVTEVPGTTRDLLREQIQLDGMPLHLVDTAGLRDSEDRVELEGIRRAREEIAQADRILWVFDDQVDPQHDALNRKALPPGVPLTLIRSKIDLTGTKAGIHESSEGIEIGLSTLSGEGIDALKQHLKACMGYRGEQEGEFIARRRHIDALERADTCLMTANNVFLETGAGELLADDLRQAQNALGEITGEFSADDLLGEIFSSFCIGK
jgi:tRNA modification GTPase